MLPVGVSPQGGIPAQSNTSYAAILRVRVVNRTALQYRLGTALIFAQCQAWAAFVVLLLLPGSPMPSVLPLALSCVVAAVGGAVVAPVFRRNTHAPVLSLAFALGSGAVVSLLSLFLVAVVFALRTRVPLAYAEYGPLPLRVLAEHYLPSALWAFVLAGAVSAQWSRRLPCVRAA